MTDKEEEDLPTIAIDIYGIKVKKSIGGDTEDPNTWRDVWLRVQRHMRRIAVSVPGTVADVLDAVRSIAQMPVEAARNVQRARMRAEMAENQKQAVALEPAGLPARIGPSDEGAPVALGKVTLEETEGVNQEDIIKIAAIFHKIHEAGGAANLVKLENGKFVMVICQRGQEDPAIAVARKMMSEGSDLDT